MNFRVSTPLGMTLTRSRGHADVVAEYHALEAEFTTQDVGDPDARVACRFRIHLRINHMRHHHRFRTGVDGVGERHEVFSAHRFRRALVHGAIEVRVLEYRAVAGEMLERHRHAGQAHASLVGKPEFGDDLGTRIERARADRAIASRKIQHRREAQVDADRTHFAGHQPGVFLGTRQSLPRIGVVQGADPGQRGQLGETLAKALHGSAFLIDADEEFIAAQRADRIDQRRHRRARDEIALEQDHAADLRRGELLALGGGEFESGQADDQHVILLRARARSSANTDAAAGSNCSSANVA